MNYGPIFTVVDKECSNLFTIDYVPPIGSTLSYHVDWDLMRDKAEFSSDTIKWWESIDGKYYEVINVYGEVRNYNGKDTVVHFVEVKEISKNKGNI